MTNPWSPPSDWIRITTLEAHTAGEPLRIFTGGIPPIPGDTILEKRRFASHELDALRTTLMWEPRGHADMYGAILTEPVTEDGDCGVLFLHNEGFSTMCGHGILGLAMAGIEAGVVPVRTEQEGDTLTLRLDTPAGRVTAFARKGDGRVRDLNPPSEQHFAPLQTGPKRIRMSSHVVLNRLHRSPHERLVMGRKPGIRIGQPAA